MILNLEKKNRLMNMKENLVKKNHPKKKMKIILTNKDLHLLQIQINSMNKNLIILNKFNRIISQVI
jgi:hypothetical protein